MDASARRIRLGAAVLVGAVALGGCVTDEVGPEPSAPASSEAELTDEELQAEAEAVSLEFFRLVDLAYSELAIPDAIYEIASDEVVSNVAADLQGFIDAGYRVEGTSSLENFASAVERPEGDRIRVMTIVCWDTNGNRVVDASGQPVPGDGVERHPLALTAELINRTLVITDSDFPAEPVGGTGCDF